MAVMLTAPLVFSQPHGGMGRGFDGKGKAFTPCEKMIPDLTDEQRQKINDFRIEMLKEVQPLQNQIRELKASFHALITGDNPDINAIDKNIDQRSDLHDKIMKTHARFRLNIAGILTDDQKVIFNSQHPGMGMMRGPKTGRGMRSSSM